MHGGDNRPRSAFSIERFSNSDGDEVDLAEEKAMLRNERLKGSMLSNKLHHARAKQQEIRQKNNRKLQQKHASDAAEHRRRVDAAKSKPRIDSRWEPVQRPSSAINKFTTERRKLEAASEEQIIGPKHGQHEQASASTNYKLPGRHVKKGKDEKALTSDVQRERREVRLSALSKRREEEQRLEVENARLFQRLHLQKGRDSKELSDDVEQLRHQKWIETLERVRNEQAEMKQRRKELNNIMHHHNQSYWAPPKPTPSPHNLAVRLTTF